jgi:hypothetical protein
MEIEVKDAFGTAAGGGAIMRRGAVLEFNFYLRSNSTMPSKDAWLPEGQPTTFFRKPQAIKKAALAAE